MIELLAFKASLYVATLLETLVFGWVLIFMIVVMPGISNLEDGEFLGAFQAIDGIIQDNQPMFVLVWMGSVIAMLVCNILALVDLDNHYTTDKALLTISTLMFLITQYTTFTKNVPLNNHVKMLSIPTMDSFARRAERVKFEASWKFWNDFRTVIMGVVSLYLLSVLLRI